jgi:hypothetical protein
MAEPPNRLRGALDFKLSEVIRYDFFIGLAGGAAFLWLSLRHAAKLNDVLPLATGLIGVVIGAVLAGVAVLAAFLNQPFLRKLRAINREPTRYLRPFLFTAFLGVIAALLSMLVAGLPATAPVWLSATLGGLDGMAIAWTITSVIPGLGMLVEFVGLQFDASDVPDDFAAPLPPESSGTTQAT